MADNRCARCGGALRGRKLETNYHDDSTGELWFVSGLPALGHRCGGIREPRG